jgi:hypothetical protein
MFLDSIHRRYDAGIPVPMTEVPMTRAIMLAAVLLLLLSACQTTYEASENSPYYEVPVGSTLVLNQDVIIPPNKAGIYIQGGLILPLAQVNQYYPHCKFEVQKLRDSSQTVTADTFAIVKVVKEITDSVDAGRIRLAGRAMGIGISARDDDGPSLMTYATRLYLRSGNQPEVLRLSCGLWAYTYQGQHLTLSEIRKALGTLFTLHPAQGGHRSPG